MVGFKKLAEVSGYPLTSLERLIVDAPVEPDKLVGEMGVRYFGEQKVFAVCVAAHLHRAGATVTAQRKAARFLAKANLNVRMLQRGEKYLVVHFDQVFVAREDAVFTATRGGKTPAAAFVIVDLERALEQFRAKLAPAVGNNCSTSEQAEEAHASA